MTTLTSRSIHVYPCVDGLLYSPVYLAIKSYYFRAAVQGRMPSQLRDKSGFPYTEWSFEDGLSVRLYAPSPGGDEANYQRLLSTRQTKGELHIAIGDPTAALLHEASDDREFQIVGTFVNRIALWAVARQNSDRIHAAPGGLSIDAETRAARQDAVNDMLRLAEHGVAPLYPKARRFQSLRLGFCEKGATTSAVVNCFAAPAFTVAAQQPATLGEAELRGVIDGDYDVTFSHAPWLLHGLVPYAQREDFAVVPWFQAVPYPFSALVICASKDEREAAEEILIEFLQHVLVGLALLYRYKQTATAFLKTMSMELRYFGLGHVLKDDVKDRMLADAFSKLVISDCFCESLENAWVAWDLAFEASAKTKQDMKRGHARLREIERYEYRLKTAAEDFSNVRFRDILNRMVEFAGLENFSKENSVTHLGAP